MKAHKHSVPFGWGLFLICVGDQTVRVDVHSSDWEACNKITSQCPKEREVCM